VVTYDRRGLSRSKIYAPVDGLTIAATPKTFITYSRR
jgi:hypothetical protein